MKSCRRKSLYFNPKNQTRKPKAGVSLFYPQLQQGRAMAATTFKRLFLFLTPPPTTTTTIFLRFKTTSAQYVASRARDPTFEKLMDNYKNLLKVISIQDLILAASSSSSSTPSTPNSPSISIEFLDRLSQKLHLNRGAASFLRKYPHIFHLFNHPIKFQPFCTLTPIALQIIQQESEAINTSLPSVVERLVKLLSISITKTVPLRAVFKVWKELGLPDDFEESVIANNPSVFLLTDGNERNTHYLKLNSNEHDFVASVENWRIAECCKEDYNVDRTNIRYRFKHSYPPGMVLKKTYKAKVEEWQRLPYIGPYDEIGIEEKRKTKCAMKRNEKRAVGIVHEFLSLTVEKTIEVEKISQFRKWFGIDLNIRDLFLDHPGMFYLSTKGKRHTVFLREAYFRGCLIEPNSVYEARRKLLHLVAMGRRGLARRDDEVVKRDIHGEEEHTKDVESSSSGEEECED